MLDKSLLSDFDFFSDINQDSLEAIARKCEILEYGPTDNIFQQDETAVNFYGLLEGEVELVLIFKEKVVKKHIEYEESIVVRDEIIEKPIVVDTIKQGEIIGWSSMITSSGKWSATARCLKNSKIFSIPADELKAMFAKDSRLGYLFMDRLAGLISLRLHHRQEKLIDAWGHAFDVHRI